MRITDTHVYFWGSYLSNFWLCPVPLDVGHGQTVFASSEHAFMAQKALAFDDVSAFEQILLAPDGKAAKAIGRKVVGFDPDVWDKLSDPAMLSACRGKFFHNSGIADELRSTGKRTLVEASPYDVIWGVGLHETNDLILDEANWRGQNRLGRTLGQVRSELP